jgi:hypothetical protein
MHRHSGVEMRKTLLLGRVQVLVGFPLMPDQKRSLA